MGFNVANKTSTICTDENKHATSDRCALRLGLYMRWPPSYPYSQLWSSHYYQNHLPPIHVHKRKLLFLLQIGGGGGWATPPQWLDQWLQTSQHLSWESSLVYTRAYLHTRVMGWCFTIGLQVFLKLVAPEYVTQDADTESCQYSINIL